MHERFPFLALLLLGSTGIAQATAQRLLMKEVVLTPTAGECIAIFNPNPSAVDLTNYYLSDNRFYYTLATGVALDSGDFVVRFPAGASIAPGQSQYISLAGTPSFATSYGVNPDYELASSSGTVPDMLVVAASGTPSLTNSGEPVILFYWDGVSNLVVDVDYVYPGAGTATNTGVNKTGVMVNGEAYLPDTVDGPVLHAAVTSGAIASCRKDFAETGQTSSAGNGVGGADETSEPSSLTWHACAFPTAPDRIFADGFDS